jgi:hypothetical protein
MAGTVPSPDGQRIAPNLPAESYRTFQVASPLATHWRDGTCEEADCAAYLRGWATAVDEATDLGARQAHYIRNVARRGYTEDRTGGTVTTFTFAAGQRCFASPHKVPLERPELYVVRGGDWRGNPRGTEPVRHSGPDPWLDDFQTNQDRLGRLIERG